MKIVILALFLLVLVRLSAYSQPDFVRGYIQITKHDTIFGLINYRVDKKNCLECRFKKTVSDTVRTFTPEEIYGYRFLDSKYYVSRQITDDGELKTVFLEYLLEGVVDLYYYRDRNNHYLMGKQNLPIQEISLRNNLIFIDGVAYKRKSLINRNLVKFYLQDCPQLFYVIDHMTDAQHKELIQLIKKYHDIQCPNDVCLIYQKKMPKFRVDIEPVVGFTNFPNSSFVDYYPSKHLLQYGVLSYFWLPLENEKLFLKTGIIIDRLEGTSTNNYDPVKLDASLFKMPFQFHYQFLDANVTPVISAGVNIYSMPGLFDVFPALSVGVNAKITNNFYATLSSDIDYSSPYFIIPLKNSQVVSYSFSLGLAVTL